MGIIEIVILIVQIGLLAVLAKRVFSGKKTQPPKDEALPVHPCSAAHDLIAIDAQILFTEMMPFPQTVVLKRCRRCAFHASIGYAGKWTITDFLKEKSDIDVLEGMIR